MISGHIEDKLLVSLGIFIFLSFNTLILGSFGPWLFEWNLNREINNLKKKNSLKESQRI